MSRFEGDNPAYAATLVLSMRTRPEGGDVLSPCQERWSHGAQVPQADLLILVHGFNNNVREAQDAYLGFRRRQKSLIDPAQGDRVEPLLGDAFWPGDADWPGPLDSVDFLVYPATITRAKDTAAALSTYLKTRRDVMNLNFIGHSMGCRVVLETIKLLRADPAFRTPIRKVCLMAAAVRTDKVFPGADLAQALNSADEVRVLYSPDDPVLAFAFPVGQTAGGDGFFPTAVGHQGDVPLSPGHVDRSLVAQAGHSDYWGWRDNAASDLAAHFIAEFMAFASMSARTAAADRSAAPRPAPPARSVGSMRPVGRR